MMPSAPFHYHRLVIWIGRIVLAGIFIYAGYSKLFSPNLMLQSFFTFKFSVTANISNFGQQVRSYKMLSEPGISFVSHFLPPAEIALGLLLLLGWRFRVCASLVSLLLLGFLTIVVRAYLLGLQIDCGCFGKPEPLTGWTIIRDGSFLLLALLMTFFAFQEAQRPHPWSAGSVSEQPS
jgi:putative oxidoreductase